MQTDDRQEVLRLLDALAEAWARGDGTAYAACFTEDSDYVTYNGIRLRGRNENANMHSALFRRVLKGTRISGTVESVDFLSGDIALVLTMGSARHKSRQTYVVVKREGHWRIRAFQNTRLRPVSIWLTRVAVRLGGS